MPAAPALSDINSRRLGSRQTHKGLGPVWSGLVWAVLNGYVTSLIDIGNVYVRTDASGSHQDCPRV